MIFFFNHKEHKGFHEVHNVLLIPFCFLLISLFTLSPFHLISQISQGGLPASFSHALVDDIPQVSLPVPAFEKLRAEDVADEKQGLPRRVGIAVKADIDVIRDGKKEVLKDGTQVWQISVSCEGALAMSPCFDDFRLIDGYRMFVYDKTRKVVLGA